MAGKVRLVPVGFTLSAYQHVLTQSGLVRSFLVSAFYVVTGTSSMLVLCSLLAYPVSLKVFGPRHAVMLLVLITMLFDGGMTVDPRSGDAWTAICARFPSAMNAWYVIGCTAAAPHTPLRVCAAMTAPMDHSGRRRSSPLSTAPSPS